MSLSVNGVGSTSSVAAADITDATATGEALITAANAAAARSTLDAQQDVFTTRGDLVRAGAGGAAERFAAATADTFVGGDGTDVVARTAAQTRTSVQAAGRTIDPMTGTGWTSLTPASGSSTTWAAGVLTLAIPTAVAVSQGSGVYDVDYLSDDESYDVMCRLDVVAGDTLADGNFILWAGADVGTLANQDALLLILNSTGTIEAGVKVNGSDTSLLAATAGPSAGERTGGNLWLRITRSPAAIAFHWGVGTAGAVPTSTQWTTVYAGATVAALNASRGYGVRADIYTFGGGVTGGWTVDVLAIRARAQNSAPL